ncbi:hypothetical protein GCK32_000133 [Trichostrongylus colubriformis]|uniref:Globin family profile domain-containing protein n=1 Tax=Trichostrongylus colubriformis TaxID=6319 RepID=A0AAN8FJP3_TRICO
MESKDYCLSASPKMRLHELSLSPSRVRHTDTLPITSPARLRRAETPKVLSPNSVRRTDNSLDIEDSDTLTLTADEAIFLQASWHRAIATTDVGAELVIRLLNDKRSLFKSLLESHTGHIEVKRFTVDVVNRDLKRAKEVGQGVVRFFTKALACLDEPDASEKIRQMSFDLGVLHYRMRVWFQAENWLCVKNSLLAVILDINPFKANGLRLGLHSLCFGAADVTLLEPMAQRRTWTKVLQFVIRNMKRGFLAEALKTDRNSDAGSASPSST